MTDDAKNQGDALVHATEKSMTELGDKVTPDERGSIEAALSDLRKALEGDNKEAIEAKTQALAQASAGMAERVYSQAEGAPEEATQEAADDDVVDAEFEEVKGDDK